MGTRFSARPDWFWGPPSLLYNGYCVFYGCRGGRCVGLTPHSHLVPKVLEKSRAIPLLTLRACVAYKKGENLPRKRHCRHCGPHPHLINAYQRPSSGAKDCGPKLTTHLHLVPRWKVMEVYLQPPSSHHGFYRGSFLRRLRKSAQSDYLLRTVCPPFRYAWNNSSPSRRVFAKFDIWVFFKNISRKYSSFIGIWQE